MTPFLGHVKGFTLCYHRQPSLKATLKGLPYSDHDAPSSSRWNALLDANQIELSSVGQEKSNWESVGESSGCFPLPCNGWVENCLKTGVREQPIPSSGGGDGKYTE